MVIREFGGGYSNRKQFVRNKTTRILIPYVIVGIFMCLIQHRSLFEMCLGVSHLWFLMTIFECYIAGYLLEEVLLYKEKKKLTIVGICCVIVVSTVHWNLPTRFLTIERFLHYFPLYLIGMLFGSLSLEKYSRYNKCMYTLLLGSIIILPFLHEYWHKAMADQLVGLIIILPLFILCHNHSFTHLNKLVACLDKHSMSIYIIHQILQQEMNKIKVFYDLMVNNVYLYPLCQFVLLITVSLTISYFAHKSKYAKYVLG